MHKYEKVSEKNKNKINETNKNQFFSQSLGWQKRPKKFEFFKEETFFDPSFHFEREGFGETRKI